MVKLTIGQKFTLFVVVSALLAADIVFIYEVLIGDSFQIAGSVLGARLLVGLCLLFTLGLTAYFFGKRVARSIGKLSDQAKQISAGNFTAISSVKYSSDELGDLAAALDGMASELQHYTAKLQNEGEKIEVVLNSVDEGVVAIDGNQNIIVANTAAAVTVHSLPRDIIGKSFTDVFHLYRNKQRFDLDMDSHVINTEVELQNSKKENHYLDLVVDKLEKDTTNIQAIVLFRDKTEQRELENMKIDFVSMAAHELRTPITSIRGYLSLAAADEDSKLSKDGAHYLERARTSSLHLVGLINNLLNVARIERGAFKMNKSRVNWSETVRNALSDQAISAEEKNINVSLIVPDDDVFVFADVMAVQEVINNIVSNAIRYTPKDGNITVEVRNSDDMISTHVSDDGLGIPKEAMELLFSKFYRVHEHIGGGVGGSGLGLYICKSIVELHGGKIWVQSDPDGIGSVFGFTLPVYDLHKHPGATHKTEGLTKRRGWVTKNITR